MLLLALVLLSAFAVRIWRIEYIPNANDGDEMAYIFAGQSLIEYGVPISWSSYEQEQYEWVLLKMDSTSVNEDMSFQLIKPWLDHSFFLPLLIGGWTEMASQHFGTIAPSLWYRIPMVIFAMGTLVLSFLIARHVFGFWPAIGTLVLLSFSPIIIMIQRMVVSENSIIFFMLLSLYLYLKKQPLLAVILASVLASLVKPTGLAVVLIIGGDLLYTKQWRRFAVYTLSSIILFLGIYTLYIWSINPSDTLSILMSQSHRLIGWSNPAFIFSQPGFQNRVVLDFSYFMLLIGGFWIFAQKQNGHERLLSMGTLILMATIWATSAEQDMLGWYKIPLFILLGINSARLLKDNNAVLFTVLLFISVVNNLGLVRYPTHPLPESLVLRGLVGVTVLFMGWLLYHPQYKKVIQTTAAIACIIFAVQSFYILHNYFGARCRDRICPTPTVTQTSEVKRVIRAVLSD